jgi:hypothetical protein
MPGLFVLFYIILLFNKKILCHKTTSVRAISRVISDGIVSVYMAWIKARNRECVVHTTYGNISGIDGIQFSRVSLNLQVHV